MMREEAPGALLLRAPARLPACQGAAAALGAWLLSSPLAFDYGDPALAWSDAASGAAAIAVAAWTLLSPRRAWVGYLNGAVGFWLLLAPLAFWARSPAVLVNDWLCGTLLLAFSVVVPMTAALPGPDLPPGWRYNPSSWPQRVPILALGMVGFLCARPMAGYQLGHTERVWEPFFGEGTVRVLTSEVSRAFPVSDAGLGAVSYLLEVLSTAMGDPRRWRTMPWMVALFGVLVVPLGVTSIVLVMLQPLSVGHWCTLCLVGAAAMLLMIAPSVDEVVASVQFLNAERKAGRSLWRAFWRGGDMAGASHSPSTGTVLWEPGAFNMTWRLALCVGLGVWAVASSEALGTGGAARTAAVLAGTLAVTFAMVAVAEVARPARFVVTAAGAALAVSTWFLSGGEPLSRASDALAGVLLVVLSVPKGRVRYSYGTFDPWIR